MYFVRHDIYEAGDSFPVVTHFFWGKTPEEAETIYHAHKQYDAFLRSCDSSRGSNFQGAYGTITCHSRVSRGEGSP